MLEWRRWQFWTALSVGLLVLLFRTGSYWSATWLSKWALIACLAGFGFSIWVAKRTSFFHLPLLLYAFGHLIVLSMWPQAPYHGQLDLVTEIALQKNAFFGLVEFASLTALVAFITRARKATAHGLFVSLVLIWGIGVGFLLFLPSEGPYSPPNNGMWFGNPSMEGSLFACLLPWVFELLAMYELRGIPIFFWAVVSWTLTFWAIIRTNASVPWGTLGVVTAVFYVRPWLSRRTIRPLLFAVTGIAILAACMIKYGERKIGYDFWNQNGRFEIWAMGWKYFREHGSARLGFGYSTSQVFIPLEQLTTGHMKGQTFLWYHNDWLQLAIEGGYIGMLCVFLSLGRLIIAAWTSVAALSSLAGFVTLGVMNYPLRMPIHCFVLAVMAGLIERNHRRFLEIRSAQTDALKPQSSG